MRHPATRAYAPIRWDDSICRFLDIKGRVVDLEEETIWKVSYRGFTGSVLLEMTEHGLAFKDRKKRHVLVTDPGVLFALEDYGR